MDPMLAWATSVAEACAPRLSVTTGVESTQPTILFWLTTGAALFGLAFLAMPALLNYSRPLPSSDDPAVRKIRLEVEDLRFGWMRTLGTAILTVAVAVGGWYFAQESGRHELLAREFDAERDRCQRDQLAAQDALARYIGDLGDTSPMKRLAAVSYVAQSYAASGGTDASRLLDVLVYRFSTERDTRVRDYLGQKIVDLATRDRKAAGDIVRAAADANRKVARDYADALGTVVGETAGRYVISQKGPEESLTGFTAADLWVLDTIVERLDRESPTMYHVPRSIDHSARQLDYGDSPTTDFNAKLSAEVVYAYAVADSLLQFPNGADSKKSRIDEAHVQELGRSLSATGNLLSIILQSGAAPSPVDLRAVYIEDIVLNGVDLTGADLRNATLIGSFTGGKLDFARLSYANLADTDLSGASVQAADLRGTILPEQWTQNRFQGSNVSDAYVARNDGTSFVRIIRVAKERERERHRQQEQCRLISAAHKRKCPY